MKKLKKLLAKSLLLAIVLSMSAAMCVGATDTWQNIYFEDFSLFDESTLTNANFPEVKVGYTTSVEDEALTIKSDNVTDWQARDDSYPSAPDNIANGIRIVSGNSVNGSLTKQDPQFDADGVLFDYTGSSTTAWAMENIGGRNAIRILSFPQDTKVNNAWSYRTNEYRIAIDEGRFAESRTAYDIEVDLYFPAGKKPTFVTFSYSKSATGTASVQLTGAELRNMPVDEWTTWKFTVDNGYFGKVGKFYGSVNANIIVTQSNYAYSKTATTYVGRIAVKPSVTDDYTYTSMEKTVKLPFGFGEIYGNTRASFDMSLPATERYSGFTMYNNGNNSARVSLTNENDDEVAAVQVDSTDDGQSIYAITEDNGEEIKELLYEGEILGQTLSYQFEVDWKAKTYTVSIKNGNELLDENNAVYGPFAIANSSLVDGNVLIRNFRIRHNTASEVMMTVIDNISVDYIEDPDRVNCKADADALTLGIADGAVVTEGFALPTSGENGSEITWESSAPGVIAINAEGDACTLTRAATRVTVTLTATLDINGVKVLKSFDVTVEKSDDQFKVEEDAAAVTLNVPPSGLVIENFELPTVGTVHGTDITWESSNPAVLTINAEGNGCILTRGAAQVRVTLTATANLNGYTASSEHEVIVCEHDDFLKARADLEAIELGIPETGRVKDDFTLPITGALNSSTITWTTNDAATVAISGNTAVVNRFDTNKEVTLTASATLNGFTATREFKIVSATLRGVSAEIYDVEETVSGGYLTARVDVQYPGKSGTLNFLAVVTNPQTGEILAREMFTKTLSNSDRYATVTCTVSGLPFADGNEANYYVWNEKRESFVNNAPSAVEGLTAEGRGKGVRLNWEASIDDNNSVEYYAVYRDGEYIGTAVEETYLDETAEIGAVYNYEVRGVDTNDMFGTGKDKDCTPKLGMYYYNFDKQGKGELDYKYGLEYRQSDSGDAHSWITEVVDANGEKVYAATSFNKWVIGKTDKNCIDGSVRDIMFEVVYLDTSGNITMVHNQVIPQGESDNLTYARKSLTPITGMQGTYQWKTAVFPISDANFRESGYWSGADFGFRATTNEKMFIREIRVIQADLYD